MSVLESLQKLQLEDRALAEVRTAEWMRSSFNLSIGAVRLHASAAAINSFFGFVEFEGQEVFFKTHPDPEVIRHEYNNMKLLIGAGYPTLEPIELFEGTETAMLLYPIVDAPKGRDFLEANEISGDTEAAGRLLAAQTAESEALLAIYRKTAQRSGPDAPASSRVHALFSERLADSSRWGAFYSDQSVPLPQGGSIPTSEVFDRCWIINGVVQPRSLMELVNEGRRVLDPAAETLTVIGHGDAHLDNVFVLDDHSMLYFDAAFSGRHSPMLDVAKNVFEALFSRWMYFPQEVAAALDLTVAITDEAVRVDYGPWIPPVRRQVYAHKQQTFLQPLFAWLEEEQASPFGLRPYHLALMCAALVTANPLNAEKYSPSVAWLGLAISAQLGNLDVEQELRIDE